MKESLISNLFIQAGHFNDFKNLYLGQFSKMISYAQDIDLGPFLDAVLRAHQEKRQIFFCGNGGSAANANHFSCGVSYITDNYERPIKSISLSSDSHLITSLANDYGYDQIFKKQLEVHLEEGDLLVCFSVSGQSKNVLEAARFALKKNASVFAFVGHDGGELLQLVDHAVHIPHDDYLFGLTEDMHMIMGHLTCYYLREHFKSKKGPACEE